ncbi:activator of 90 kDa heat shock protein ATPase1-like [Scleropages formosus]|uniref:Activator of 90 kDa heat shock protein ATPase1-like n=1 Tax=Scleropages formosus TaxID=113540 RepID=A0A0P7UI77_SCLFO|nr:activator of 90 kDa heat shock protein ATPase1-like [Scleropages formosus]
MLTERDVTSWSSDKLKELLLGVYVENEEGSCEITEVSKLEGEASINNRKGKLIFFYEWDVKATWKGTSNMGVRYTGNLEVPNLSDENDMDELDGMILPTANGVSKQQESQCSVKVDKTQFGSASSAPRPTTGVKIPTCKFTMKETFLTSPEELYRVFTNQEMVQAFTHGAALVEGEKGGKFRLLDGNVLGEFQELVPEQKIVMKWRYNTWPCEHYATVTINLTDHGSDTELSMECKGVPGSEEERTREGWQRYYFEAIKQTFGYGARLY